MMTFRIAAIAAVFCASTLESAQVTYDRLLNAGSDLANWLTYSGAYRGWRYSGLEQVRRENVQKLKVKWVYQMHTTHIVETTPLVIDGVMYISEPPSNVVALDAETGAVYWRYHRVLPSKINVCCGQVNRGVAVLGDRVFIGTVDAHLVSLDAKTGATLWDVPVADYRTGHSITVAPLALNNMIVCGISGGEYGIRGFLDAYDPKSGKRLWRFWTIPEPGQPGSETWSGNAWKTGGGPTWVTGSFDPEQNLIIWGTGNPSPDWNGDSRPGDNLYTDSAIALDAATGKLKWHYQFVPHDVHDWDAVQVPNGRAGRESWSTGRIAAASTMCWIARRESCCSENRSLPRPGPRAWIRTAAPSVFLILIPLRKARTSGRACRARRTGIHPAITRLRSSSISRYGRIAAFIAKASRNTRLATATSAAFQ
jgi:alcohol dehydrogenase (cytochrome c)